MSDYKHIDVWLTWIININHTQPQILIYLKKMYFKEIFYKKQNKFTRKERSYNPNIIIFSKTKNLFLFSHKFHSRFYRATNSKELKGTWSLKVLLGYILALTYKSNLTNWESNNGETQNTKMSTYD